MKKQLIATSALITLTFISAIITAVFITGCSKVDNESLKAVATVNKEIISFKDFQRDLAIKAKQNPSYVISDTAVKEQLTTSIDKKLMIQEAMKMGLANNEDFVRTIQVFWEQTLVRELIEAKNNEWKDRLFVTKAEVENYYKKINKDVLKVPPLEAIYDQIKQAKLEQKRTEALEKWLAEVREKASIEINNDLLETIAKSDDSVQSSGGYDGR